MDHDTTVADRLRYLRAARGGLTQEQLAEKAGVSVTIVRKLEQGGTARMETYHHLARALGVRTVWFMTSDTPVPHAAPERDAALAAIRSAISPPMGLHGRLVKDDDTPPDLGALSRSVDAISAAYEADAYDTIARIAPHTVHSAHMHVRELDGRDRDRARWLRASALQVTGRYLIQVREHDLALTALGDSLRDALEVGAQDLAAAAISSQARALLRQARFDEVERLCVAAADEIEPRMSRATRPELAAWGLLLMRAAAAAARNNRAEEARDLQSIADSAASRLGAEGHYVGHVRFGPASSAMNKAQGELIAGDPEKALGVSVPDANEATPSTRHRYELDRASAHLMMGDADSATDIMSELRMTAPSWFRQQQAARNLAEDVLANRPRRPSEEQRANAIFLGVAV